MMIRQQWTLVGVLPGSPSRSSRSSRTSGLRARTRRSPGTRTSS